MPPKGWSAGREETEVKAVRVPTSMIERIANHVERLQSQFRAVVRVNEGMAIRDLLAIGLDTVEATTPQPHPALSLAPEAVPPPTLLPGTETPSVTTQTPAAKPHRDPPAHIVKIAEVAAEYDKLSTRALARLLYDRNVYRATAAKTAEEKPVSPGTLARWLNEAREAGLL